ncbi:hypothetical protein D3874_22115 [Oleomonas cavernae]|uniref:PEGA domain-containing protein n=2 Tax=Oleomonas cavernae TaxID=2320859 RepID=A0A418WH16_9PROT|nr:hypothetical protein D3874_22115 [Oleomonas cavernae]
MPIVTILSPGNRLLYIDGVYSEKAGRIPVALILPDGPHVLETVNSKRQVDYRLAILGNQDIDVRLTRVIPPEPLP